MQTSSNGNLQNTNEFLNQIKNKPLDEVFNYQNEFDENYLKIAIDKNDSESVNYLLEIGFDPDGINLVNNAYSKKYFDIVLVFLENNSKFPKNFKTEIDHSGLNNFIQQTQDFYEKFFSLHGLSDSDIDEYRRKYPKLRYFYCDSTEIEKFNKSASYLALNKRKDKNLVERLGKYCFIPHSLEILKDFDDISLRILRNCRFIGDISEPLRRIKTLFEFLVSIEEVKSTLEYLGCVDNFIILFNFRNSNNEIKNLILNNGKGYIKIDSNDLPRFYYKNSQPPDIYGIVMKELHLYVMKCVFKNNGKPYGQYERRLKTKFKRSLENRQKNDLNVSYNKKGEKINFIPNTAQQLVYNDEWKTRTENYFGA